MAEDSKSKPKPKLACRFYRTDAGNEPVRDWLLGLPAEARKQIGEDIGLVQWGGAEGEASGGRIR